MVTSGGGRHEAMPPPASFKVFGPNAGDAKPSRRPRRRPPTLCFRFGTSYLFVVLQVGATPLQVTSDLGPPEPRRVCGRSSGRLFLPRLRSSAQAPPRHVPEGAVVGEMLLCVCVLV